MLCAWESAHHGVMEFPTLCSDTDIGGFLWWMLLGGLGTVQMIHIHRSYPMVVFNEDIEK